MVARALGWSLQKDAPLHIPPRFDPALWRWLFAFARHCNPADWHRTALAKSALLNQSRDALASWVREFDLQCEFMETGEDYVFRDEHAFVHGQEELDVLNECGVNVEVMDGASYEASEPAVRKGVAGVLRFRGDASVRPDVYVDELARVLRERGVVIEENCALQGLSSVASGWSVETSCGAFTADNVVLCTGAWTPKLRSMFSNAAWTRAIQPGKGYSLTYTRPAIVPSRPIVLRERTVCVSTWGDRFRLGSTMEFSGFDESLNRVRLDALVKAAHEYLYYPHGPELLEEWYGWRPMSSDDIPLIGPVPGERGLWVNVGHGMMGMSMSTASAQMLAAMMIGGEPSVDPSAYTVGRFS